METFGGTTQKCKACEKTIYLVDELTADKNVYCKACFICHHCKGTLKLSNYSSFEGVLYCKPQFDQLFKRTGSLDKSFGGTDCSLRDRSLSKLLVSTMEINTIVIGTMRGVQRKSWWLDWWPELAGTEGYSCGRSEDSVGCQDFCRVSSAL
ncbi:hypothetical protein UlMin_028948 [Ulmus minor]